MRVSKGEIDTEQQEIIQSSPIRALSCNRFFVSAQNSVYSDVKEFVLLVKLKVI